MITDAKTLLSAVAQYVQGALRELERDPAQAERYVSVALDHLRDAHSDLKK
jgi:hypothetical protein